MIPVLLVMFGTALQTTNTVWVDAFEAREHGVQSAEARTYNVWAWTSLAKPAELTIGTKTLAIPADPAATGYAWKRVGEVDLPKGRAGVALTDNIASIILTTRAEYDPARALADMRAALEPVAPGDGRVTIERDTDTIMTMTPFQSREDWEAFAGPLREKFLVACGLWPMPERTPLNAKVKEAARHDDYIVENVSFEAFPGFLVTGNLYRPVGDGPYPGVICPHGHWANGRFENTDTCSVAARCITFARMGMAAFSYDMVGYNDSRQFPREWGHSGGNVSEDVRRREALWGIHPFAVQLWSSVRALDFMESLPYVDKDKLACTGASGGGTQTFALYAIDPRVKVSAPVNMISHSMQGGCPCENAPLIRFNASNMEIGALMAPRPMMMISATGDWTKDTPRVEYPAIRGIYALYGKEADVESIQIDAGHNYNKASREGVYRFFGKHILDGEQWAAFTEPPYTMEPVESLKVFPGDTPPEGYPDYDALVAQLRTRAQDKWTAQLPKSPAGLEVFRALARPALGHVFGMTALPSADARTLGQEQRGDHTLLRLRIASQGGKDAIPALLYVPMTKARKGTVLIVHGKGKAALADLDAGGPGELVKRLLADGRAVLTIDVFLVGEAHAPMKRTERMTKRFPDTFLPTDTAYRVQDVLAAAAYARTGEHARGAVDLIGLGEGGVWCLFAGALDSELRAVVCDADGFAADDDAAWAAIQYLPSIRALGDIVTAAALNAPHRLTIVNAGSEAAWQRAANAYAAVTGATAGDVLSQDALSPESLAGALP